MKPSIGEPWSSAVCDIDSGGKTGGAAADHEGLTGILVEPAFALTILQRRGRADDDIVDPVAIHVAGDRDRGAETVFLRADRGEAARAVEVGKADRAGRCIASAEDEIGLAFAADDEVVDPSPLTSPAPATGPPPMSICRCWLLGRVARSMVLAKPWRVPKTTSVRSAEATMMSARPSPLTSPPLATELPRPGRPWR